MLNTVYLRISIYRKTDERVDERTYGPRMHLKRDLAFFRSGNVAQKKDKNNKIGSGFETGVGIKWDRRKSN